jgi:Concanavalin A-like lectin/glucanases superfamily
MSFGFDPKFIHTSKVASTTLTNGIVAYYKLDDSSSPAIDQVSGNNLSIGASTTVSQSGKLGNSVKFVFYNTWPDSTSGIIGSLQAALQLSSAGTVAAWIISNMGNFYSGDIAGACDDTTYGYSLRITSNASGDDTPRVGGRLADSSAQQDILGNTTVTDGSWHHVAFTWNGTYALVYLDGTLDCASNNPQTKTPAFNNPGDTPKLCIGRCYATYAANPFAKGDAVPGSGPGYIDSVGFWNRALTSSEISSLYNGGSGKEYPFS